jgi:DNA-directed RNA polymerase subunit RPC12/RpoP
MKKKSITFLIVISLLVCFSIITLAVGLHFGGLLCTNHTYKCTKCGSYSYSRVTYYHHHYENIRDLLSNQNSFTDYDYPEYKCAKCGTLWNGKVYKHINGYGSARCY